MTDKQLMIVGTGDSMERGIEIAIEQGYDLWTLCNAPHSRATMHWEIHAPGIRAKGLEDMRKVWAGTGPDTKIMYAGPVDAELMPSRQVIPWPMVAYRKFFGFGAMQDGSWMIQTDQIMEDYLANTVSYMVAYAVMQRYPVVHMYGVEAHPLERTESPYEHPCIAFYVGWGTALGMSFSFSPTSHLFTTGPRRWRGIYGQEQRPEAEQPQIVTRKVTHIQKRGVLMADSARTTQDSCQTCSNC